MLVLKIGYGLCVCYQAAAGKHLVARSACFIRCNVLHLAKCIVSCVKLT